MLRANRSVIEFEIECHKLIVTIEINLPFSGKLEKREVGNASSNCFYVDMYCIFSF